METEYVWCCESRLWSSCSSRLSQRWPALSAVRIFCAPCSSSSPFSLTARLSTEVGYRDNKGDCPHLPPQTLLTLTAAEHRAAFCFHWSSPFPTEVKPFETAAFGRVAALSLTGSSSVFSGSGRDDRFSVQWVAVSLSLCAAAMLCKEQGITVLVQSFFLYSFILLLSLLKPSSSASFGSIPVNSERPEQW